MTLTMDWVWLIACIVLLIIEVVTVGNLISIWFAIGAVGALIASLVTDSLPIQVLVFAFVSILALIIIRPLASKMLRGNVVSTNADRYIGRQVLLDTDITEGHWGKIKINGEEWSTTTPDGSEIKAGTRVEIIAIEGVKLIVRSV